MGVTVWLLVLILKISEPDPIISKGNLNLLIAIIEYLTVLLDYIDLNLVLFCYVVNSQLDTKDIGWTRALPEATPYH